MSWSHYLKLMRIDNVDERHFYEEIEATRNHWGIKELNRQCNSALYERLACSRNIFAGQESAAGKAESVGTGGKRQ